jgi:hypothetical protein
MLEFPRVSTRSASSSSIITENRRRIPGKIPPFPGDALRIRNA